MLKIDVVNQPSYQKVSDFIYVFLSIDFWVKVINFWKIVKNDSHLEAYTESGPNNYLTTEKNL